MRFRKIFNRKASITKDVVKPEPWYSHGIHCQFQREFVLVK